MADCLDFSAISDVSDSSDQSDKRIIVFFVLLSIIISNFAEDCRTGRTKENRFFFVLLSNFRNCAAALSNFSNVRPRLKSPSSFGTARPLTKFSRSYSKTQSFFVTLQQLTVFYLKIKYFLALSLYGIYLDYGNN